MGTPIEHELLRPHCEGGVLVAKPELLAVRGRHGETLLHRARRVESVQTLLALGLDPNVEDSRGRTPLMYPKDAAANRVLVQAGADVLRTDHAGHGPLELQANPPDDLFCFGYLPPDFAALDVLLAAGAIPPTRAQHAAWIEDTGKMVTSAGEATDHRRFAKWLDGVARG